MAELLLDRETINHDDLVALIGARPFKAHKTYSEFISANAHAKKEDEEQAEKGEEHGDEGKQGEEEETRMGAS